MNFAITGLRDQAQALDKLKTVGAQVIQSSNGLVCKTTLSLAELEQTLGKGSGRIEPITEIAAQSPDVQKFLAD